MIINKMIMVLLIVLLNINSGGDAKIKSNNCSCWTAQNCKASKYRFIIDIIVLILHRNGRVIKISIGTIILT